MLPDCFTIAEWIVQTHFLLFVPENLSMFKYKYCRDYIRVHYEEEQSDIVIYSSFVTVGVDIQCTKKQDFVSTGNSCEG